MSREKVNPTEAAPPGVEAAPAVTEPPPSAPAKPDAIRFPDYMKEGAGTRAHLRSVTGKFAKSIRPGDEPAAPIHFRDVGGGQTLASLEWDANKTSIYFPTGHPLAGQPRYRWERQPDGVEYGFKVPEPTEDESGEI